MSTPAAGRQVIPEWTLADHLRKARQIAEMSQAEFSEHIGVKSSAYAQWEAGNNRPRDVVTIAKRVELLTHIPAAWILGINDERPHPGGGQPHAPLPDESPPSGLNRRPSLYKRNRRPALTFAPLSDAA